MSVLTRQEFVCEDELVLTAVRQEFVREDFSARQEFVLVRLESEIRTARVRTQFAIILTCAGPGSAPAYGLKDKQIRRRKLITSHIFLEGPPSPSLPHTNGQFHLALDAPRTVRLRVYGLRNLGLKKPVRLYPLHPSGCITILFFLKYKTLVCEIKIYL